MCKSQGSTNFIDVHPLESCLEYFEVVYKLMFQFGLKFHFLQKNAPREQHVHELTISRP